MRVKITTGTKGGSSARAATSWGRRTEADGYAAVYAVTEHEHVLEIPFTYAGIANVAHSLDQLVQWIPQYAYINEVSLTTNETFVGGTSLAVSLVDKGTGANAVAALAATLTAALVKGAVAVGAGAAVGASVAADKQVKLTAVGTYTAGEGTIRVVFTPLLDHINQQNG